MKQTKKGDQEEAVQRIAMSNLVQQFEAVGVRFDPAQIYELIAQA